MSGPGLPAPRADWVPRREAGGTSVVGNYIWQNFRAWESLRALTVDEMAGRKETFVEIDWDGEVAAVTGSAVMMRFPGVPRGSSPWVPLAALRAHEAAPGERPRFFVASYLAGRGPLAPHRAAENPG